ncbi:hypothetical protein MSAN_01944800 [Mycena sanguinolenta]|uniref:Uncharacterized protein n=1 Tax=Mycena sanguinolenta TaxID=230812 RepID=A0A8H6XMT8_9AGAR|nr:hypothetical protein MSAN_01944800 [Mycena sanguinolenta]
MTMPEEVKYDHVRDKQTYLRPPSRMALQRERNRFPLMCTNTTPTQAGYLDARGFQNPSYTYGWIVPFDQLVDALRKALGEAPYRLQGGVYQRWIKLGYGEKYGTRTRPELKVLYDPRTDSVLVDITNNHSVSRLALANPEFVEACRNALGAREGHRAGSGVVPVRSYCSP